MSETLSQDEVSALLRGISDGDVGTIDAAAPVDAVRPIDLTAGERFVGRRFHGLDLAQERFVRRLRQSLGVFLGSPPNVEAGEIELIKFGTFRNRLTTPSSLHLFTMAPLRGQALAVVAPALAYALIDRVFGGSGRAPATLAPREYSAIEVQMLQRLVSQALADLAEAWKPLQRMSCVLVRSEMNPASIALTALSETVLVATVQCEVGEEPAPLTFAMPFNMLEVLRDKLGEPQASPTSLGPDSDWVAALGAAVRGSDLTVAAELATIELSARDLLHLKAGDVLPLPGRPEEPVRLCVEGVRVLTAIPGVSRGNNAVRVVARP